MPRRRVCESSRHHQNGPVKHVINLPNVFVLPRSFKRLLRDSGACFQAAVIGRIYEREKKNQVMNLKQFPSAHFEHSEKEGSAATAKRIAALHGDVLSPLQALPFTQKTH